MPLCGATTDERSNDSPFGRGKGRQALGWVVASKRRPTPSGCATAVAARPLSLRQPPLPRRDFLGRQSNVAHGAEPVESLPQRIGNETSAYQACRNFDLIQNVKDFLRSLEKGIHGLILA